MIVAVPHVKEAEALERRLSGLAEKVALRVLIYDTDDATTFPPFHRSLLATLTLRFPAPSSSASGDQYAASDPYNPQPTQIPHIHAFISLYPLNPSPPSQPGALPALPTLVQPSNGPTPMLLTLYPSSASLVTPDSFASQVLTTNHQLLGANLSAATAARVVSVYVGEVALPSLPAIITEGRALSRRELARQRLRESAKSPSAALSIVSEIFQSTLCSLYKTFANALGIGAASRDYGMFENKILRALKSNYGGTFYAGQRSFIARMLAGLPPRALNRALALMPPMPSETGPAPPPPPKGTGTRSTRSSNPGSRSASSSDHEAEDLVSSIHTAGTTQSSAESSGLEGSWVGLDGGA